MSVQCKATELERDDPPRLLEPELLDELPANDPRAIQSRRDLQRVNFWMGHAEIIAGALKDSMAIGQRGVELVELGCGDGSLILKIAKRLPRSWAVRLTLVDRQKLVSAATIEEFERMGWQVQNVQADVFEWLEHRERSDGMIANLFLHHFQPDDLGKLFQLASEQTALFIGCEPKRSRWAKWESRLLGVIGCNDVTRHDAEISIRAGFQGSELSKLWPQAGDWRISERSAGLFSHLFVAQKSGGQGGRPG